MNKHNIIKYSSGLSGKASLIDETITAMRYASQSSEKEGVKKAILEDDLLGKSTHESRSTIWDKLHQRYFVNWKRSKLLAKVVEALPFETARLFIYYDFCRTEPILYDAITTPIYSRFEDGFNGIDVSDLQNWLDSKEPEHPEVNTWSPQTRKKILSNILTILRDFGLMSGIDRKTFERVYVPATMAGYILYTLKESIEQFGPQTVISSPDWRLFYLDESDVISLLKEMTHEGYCVFKKQGEIMTLDLSHHDMEAFIETIT